MAPSLKSIHVIGAVLSKPVSVDGSKHPVRGNECPEVLSSLSDHDYHKFNERFFAFVNALAKI